VAVLRTLRGGCRGGGHLRLPGRRPQPRLARAQRERSRPLSTSTFVPILLVPLLKELSDLSLVLSRARLMCVVPAPTAPPTKALKGLKDKDLQHKELPPEPASRLLVHKGFAATHLPVDQAHPPKIQFCLNHFRKPGSCNAISCRFSYAELPAQASSTKACLRCWWGANDGAEVLSHLISLVPRAPRGLARHPCTRLDRPARKCLFSMRSGSERENRAGTGGGVSEVEVSPEQ
jgi:hypothetical protein